MDRPQTSTRTPEELRSRLETWLATRLPAGAEPRVPTIDVPPTNGMSSETVLFEAGWQEGGTSRKESLVARIAPDPGAVPVFPVYDMPAQAETIRLVGELSPVPVPKVLWSEPEDTHVGAPFFVMERVDGEVPPDVMPYNFGDSWVSDASPADLARLEESSVAVLAHLFRIPDPQRHFGFLGGGSLRDHVDATRGYYEWAAGGVPSPLIDRTFAWLEDHWPAQEGPTVLSWGDSRIGNVLYRDFAPVAVLDWEMASLAPPEVDLAWMIGLHAFFEDIAHDAGLPGMPDFLQADRIASLFEAATGYAPRDLDFFLVYTQLRWATIATRVSRRAVHFGEAELPDDVDDLIMNRRLLTRLLDGQRT